MHSTVVDRNLQPDLWDSDKEKGFDDSSFIHIFKRPDSTLIKT